MAKLIDAIHVCRIVESYFEQIADGTESGEYDEAPFPEFSDYAKDFIAWEKEREDQEEMISLINPYTEKIIHELFDQFS